MTRPGRGGRSHIAPGDAGAAAVPGWGGRSHIRPVRPLLPVAGVVAVLSVWWLVGHNSGAGWVQMIGDGLAATLAVGLLGPAVALRRAAVKVTAAPGDAAAGLPVELAVAASTRVRLRPVEPPGPVVLVGPVRRRAGAGGSLPSDRLTLLPDHRGVYATVVVEVATAAPFALLWWTRRLALNLPEELLVAPRLGPPAAIAGRDDAADGEGGPPAPARVGELRGIRPYRPGDSRRWVHWPATAHTGVLMVREMEAPTTAPVTVTVVLPRDIEAAETVAERALGTVTRLLDQGIPVILATDEPAGPVVGAVADRRLAGRRLARAVAAHTVLSGPDVAIT